MKPLHVLAAVVVGLAISAAAHAAELTLVGYAVAKPVYAKIIPAFKKQYKADTGEDVTFKESYGASGAQNRMVLGGLEADVVVQNVQAYVDQLADAGLVNKDWATRLPNGASPASSVIAVVTRAGNPKRIDTWADLTKADVSIVAINPKTSGNARWGVLAGYAALLKTKDQAAADDYVRGLVRNSKTLVSGGREATDKFLKNGIGDALLTFENEAKFANKVGGQKLDYVVPNPNVRVDFPVAVIDKNVDKRGTRKAAEAFVKFLFTPGAQAIYADNGYRPADAAALAKAAGEFGRVETLITIDDLGGWPAVDKHLFADNALYDQAARK